MSAGVRVDVWRSEAECSAQCGRRAAANCDLCPTCARAMNADESAGQDDPWRDPPAGWEP